MNLIFRPLYVIYRGLSGARHWVRRRFTRAGTVVLVTWMITGLMGFDTDNSVAYQGFTVLLSLMLVGLVFMPVFRGKFSVTRSLPRYATAGQPFQYRVTVMNHGEHAQPGLTLLENLADTRPRFPFHVSTGAVAPAGSGARRAPRPPFARWCPAPQKRS